MNADQAFNARLQAFLAESARTTPPPALSERALEAVSHRRWRPTSGIAAMVVLGAMGALVVVALVVHIAGRQLPQSPSRLVPAIVPSASPSATPLVNVDSAAGEQQCLAQRQGDEQLEAEYDTTAAGADAWVQGLLPGATPAQLPLHALTPSTPVSFCYMHSPGGYPIPAPCLRLR